jgi:hypothetical protein
MNEARPEISAILISYNGMKFLPDCLPTLMANLKSFSHELIVIDNGSTDGSVGLIETLAPQARLIANDKNLGFAKAVNQGIDSARGEYLYILNQDLRFRKDSTKALLDRLKRDQSLGLIGPKFVGFDGVTQRSARAFPSYRHIFYRALLLDRIFPRHNDIGGWRMGWFDHETEMEVDQPMGAVMLIPRRVVEKVGLMDEKFWLLFNDVDYCRRIKLAGYKLLYYPGAIVEHYVGGSTSRIPYRLKLISHIALIRYLAKYARPHEYHLFLIATGLLLVSLPVLWVGLFIKRLIR